MIINVWTNERTYENLVTLNLMTFGMNFGIYMTEKIVSNQVDGDEVASVDPRVVPGGSCMKMAR